MRFFSKLIVILNCSFLVAVLLRFIELSNKKNDVINAIEPLPWLTGILVIMGYTAIIFNTLFLLLYFIFTAFTVKFNIPKWIIIFNVVILFCQLYFQFFLK